MKNLGNNINNKVNIKVNISYKNIFKENGIIKCCLNIIILVDEFVYYYMKKYENGFIDDEEFENIND